MGFAARISSVAAGLLLGLQCATQFVGWSFAWAPALGAGIRVSSDLTIYPPWRVIAWRRDFAAEEPRVFAAAISLVLPVAAGGLGLTILFEGAGSARRRVRGWGGRLEARRAGLLRNPAACWAIWAAAS